MAAFAPADTTPASSITPQQLHHTRSLLEHFPWDITETIFSQLKQKDLVSVASTSKRYYRLVHGHLWRRPEVNLTQAMQMMKHIYRRPIITTASAPQMGDLIQHERPDCVKHVTLHLESCIPAMFDIARDSVIRRLLHFCPRVRFDIHLNAEYEDEWRACVDAKSLSRMQVIPHQMEHTETG